MQKINEQKQRYDQELYDSLYRADNNLNKQLKQSEDSKYPYPTPVQGPTLLPSMYEPCLTLPWRGLVHSQCTPR